MALCRVLLPVTGVAVGGGLTAGAGGDRRARRPALARRAAVLTGIDTLQANKALVRRLVEEVLNDGRLDVLDELYTPMMAQAARGWIEPFRVAFPDVRMEIVELIAEDDTVVGRFVCSGTHLGAWRRHPPTGRRFERVDEVYFFQIRGGRITHAWGLEDTQSRLHQLGLRD